MTDRIDEAIVAMLAAWMRAGAHFDKSTDRTIPAMRAALLAALAELREPSEAMILRGAYAVGLTTKRAEACWAAMHTELLREMEETLDGR